MNCENFNQLMHEVLDARRLPESDGKLIAHARQCPACHAKLDAQELLIDWLKDSPRSTVSDGFAARVMAQQTVISEQVTPSSLMGTSHPDPSRDRNRRYPLRNIVLTMVVAALLAVVAIPVVLNHFGNVDLGEDNPVAQTGVEHNPKGGEFKDDRPKDITPNDRSVLLLRRDLPNLLSIDGKDVEFAAKQVGASLAVGVNRYNRITLVGAVSGQKLELTTWDLPDELRPLGAVGNSVSAAFDALRKQVPPTSGKPNERSSQIVRFKALSIA